jgi:Tol biopolymer transport system component
MSDDRMFERDARAWLELGPTDAPDHVVENALLAIESTSQERDLRIPWRLPSMTTQTRLAAAAVIGVLAIGSGFLLLSRGTQSPVGAPSASPTTSFSPTVGPSSSSIAVLNYANIPGWIVFEHWGWAIDGSSTAFNNDFRQIWLVHADGSNLHELAPGTPASGKTSPDISPNGATVIFASWEPLSRIWQAPIDGGAATKIAIACAAPAGVDCKQDDPAYSPDGKKVAFVRTQLTSTTISSEIGIHDLGTGKTSLIDTTRSPDGFLGQPTWSPDGLQLAYHHDTQAGPEARPTRIRIEVVNVDGTNLHELPVPAGSAMAGDPDWSPDGSLIVFSTAPNRETEGDSSAVLGIWTIRPDGTGLTSVCSPCLGGGIAPSWTPDGKHILFWGDRTWAMMNPDGTQMAHINQSKLTWFGQGLGFSYFATLQPTP